MNNKTDAIPHTCDPVLHWQGGGQRRENAQTFSWWKLRSTQGEPASQGEELVPPKVVLTLRPQFEHTRTCTHIRIHMYSHTHTCT